MSALAGTLMNSSADLVTRVCQGDSDAFRLIFERYSRPVISFIYDMVDDRALAEELTQETFVRAFRAIHTMRAETKLSTWLFGIARNVARESLRARARANSHVDRRTIHVDGASLPGDGDVHRDAIGHATVDAVDAFLRGLTRGRDIARGCRRRCGLATAYVADGVHRGIVLRDGGRSLRHRGPGRVQSGIHFLAKRRALGLLRDGARCDRQPIRARRQRREIE